MLNHDRIRVLTEYMFVEDSPLKADVTLVLGQTRWQRPLAKAIELYEAGLSGTLVFTGGYNKKLGGIEAPAMRDAWAKKGYPMTHVLVDTEATNTLENMINSRQLLEVSGIFKPGLRINLVSINYHMRRALETLRHVWGGGLEVGIANYPSQYCDPASWYENNLGRELILTEFEKIEKYLPAAYAELNLPAQGNCQL